MIDSAIKFPYGDTSEFNFNMWPRDYSNGYWCATRKVDGLFDPTFTQESHKVPEDIGDRPFSSYISNRPITLAGDLHARDFPNINSAAFAMAEACWDKDTHKIQWTLNLAGASPLDVYLNARVNQPLSMTETLDRANEVVLSWAVALVADDPLIYKLSDDSLAFSWMV